MTWIYFIQAQESGNIKIGISSNPYIRINQLRTGSHESLALLGTFIGDSRREAAIHEHFSAYRLSGEWFSPDPELLQFIQESITDIARDFAELQIVAELGNGLPHMIAVKRNGEVESISLASASESDLEAAIDLLSEEIAQPLRTIGALKFCLDRMRYIAGGAAKFTVLEVADLIRQGKLTEVATA